MNNKSKVYNECSGLLLIDKPPKWTSHDVVAKSEIILILKK